MSDAQRPKTVEPFTYPEERVFWVGATAVTCDKCGSYEGEELTVLSGYISAWTKDRSGLNTASLSHGDFCMSYVKEDVIFREREDAEVELQQALKPQEDMGLT